MRFYYITCVVVFALARAASFDEEFIWDVECPSVGPSHSRAYGVKNRYLGFKIMPGSILSRSPGKNGKLNSIRETALAKK